MPVSFLRTPADYLGINEAPQKPLFQQTNALQQGAADEMNFFNQMVGLRQQRPLAQAQAIQNQYSTIFNNAEKLRLEQQAAREAEQAVSALAGLTPEVDDYITQRQEIQRQFPNAMLDPRVQRIVDDNDRMFSSRQSSLAKQQQEAADRRAKLFGMGATPQQVEAAFQSPDAAAQLEFQLGKGASGKGNSATLKSAIDLLNDEIKAMSEAGEDYEMVGEQQVMKPEYKVLLDRRNKYRDAYLGELDKTVFPQQDATAAKEVEKPVVPSAPTSFMDTMKKGASQAPKVEDILKVTDEEVIKDINSPEATDDTFMAAISDPNASEKVKTTALERLRQFAKAPKFPLGTTSREARNRISNLQEKIKEGEKLIRMGPEMEKYRKAWTAEKNDIASDIEAYAKSLGLDADLVAADLAKNEPLTDDPENPFTIRDDFNKFLKGKLDKKATKLEPFAKSEFAKELGERADVFTNLTPTGILGQAAQALGVLPNAQKRYGDVLDIYLNEKFGQPQASQQAQEEAIVSVSTKEEVDALPKGSKFRGPDGKVRIKES